MFGSAGFVYVYVVYGMHHCLNIVTERAGFPAAVLIRAVEPVEGIAVMRARRKITREGLLTNGPGKLCEAFAIDRSLNGIDVCGRVLFVEESRENSHEIVASKRIGVDYAGDWKDQLWRFFLRHNRYVSHAARSF
jgi:DNA-3-methyladenine glycosylase